MIYRTRYWGANIGSDRADCTHVPISNLPIVCCQLLVIREPARMVPALSKKAKIGLALTAIVLCKKERKKREVWARQLYLERPKFTQTQLLAVLECDEIRNFLRMTPQIFNELLDMIRPYIEKRDTYMRKAVTFEERLIALSLIHI